MCTYIYLASDAPLPLIQWSERRPAFNVAELEDHDMAVTKQFSKRFIVFLGAHTGCSCGFAYDSEPYEDELEEVEDTNARESVQQMVEYIKEQAMKDSLEMFACWGGEQGDIPMQTLDVRPDFFIGSEFPTGYKPTLLRIARI